MTIFTKESEMKDLIYQSNVFKHLRVMLIGNKMHIVWESVQMVCEDCPSDSGNGVIQSYYMKTNMLMYCLTDYMPTV
jgi:hypothetical protein